MRIEIYGHYSCWQDHAYQRGPRPEVELRGANHRKPKVRRRGTDRSFTTFADAINCQPIAEVTGHRSWTRTRLPGRRFTIVNSIIIPSSAQSHCFFINRIECEFLPSSMVNAHKLAMINLHPLAIRHRTNIWGRRKPDFRMGYIIYRQTIVRIWWQLPLRRRHGNVIRCNIYEQVWKMQRLLIFTVGKARQRGLSLSFLRGSWKKKYGNIGTCLAV